MSDQITVKVPDIGGASGVDIIELLVKPGDKVDVDTSLITLESDKASMEIPSPVAGEVVKLEVKLGDKVSEGDAILVLKAADKEKSSNHEVPKKEEDIKEEAPKPAPKTSEPQESAPIKQEPAVQTENIKESAIVSAGPSVRRLAREFGVQLSNVSGSGRKSRITKEDLQNYVKSRLSGQSAGPGLAIPPAQAIDFSKFGSIETKPLNKIKKLTGVNVHRSWITIPHVTQFDEADITELEAFRKAQLETAQESGYKLTILAFVTKVVCQALKKFPQFNASLDVSGDNIIYKNYVNIGIAVETPNGLVVPVIKQIDQLSVADIAKEMAVVSKKAREKGLMPADMSGGCFTISSLGGIGGTAFTPIVNSPEVAILGLSRSLIKPVYLKNEFQPRLMLPLSLSYDHRVIDGAEAARFTRYIVDMLSDIRKVLL
jgi:pyruvate dehydrogenase E2 component (dihydrolipoamide acetyltransferase)